jgi:hypothetical protein
MPPAKRPIRQPQQLLPHGLGSAAAVDHRLEVAAEMHHPNAIDELRTTLVIAYKSTTRPYAPRSPRQS